MTHKTIPTSVNYHLLQPCNMRCRFCYATFRDVDGRLGREQGLVLVGALAAAGFEKITFAGGEPTLCPWLPDLVRAAKSAGMTTMLVTNGTKLDEAEWIFAPDGPLDWVALSIDSASEATHLALGRAEQGRTPICPAHYRDLARRLHAAGVRLKVNTVVTSLTMDEDMTAFIRALAPERWKVLRVLPVGGQNDGKVEPLLVSAEQFAAFVDRHRPLESEGITIVGEDHDDIIGGYAMIDPLGRFFDDTKGHHTYSAPILEVGVREAFSQVTFATSRFIRRGGVYPWRRAKNSTSPVRPTPRLVAFVGPSGSGKDVAAGHLVDQGFVRIAVADPLKRAVQSLFDLDDEQLWGKRRDEVDPRLGVTPRELYQRFSDACRELDTDVWLRPWRRAIEAEIGGGKRVVCSDLRTHAELESIQHAGGVVLRLRRGGAGAPGQAGLHSTETELAGLGDDRFDAVIDNDRDLASLFEQIDRIVGRR